MSSPPDDRALEILRRSDYNDFGDRGRLAVIGGGYLNVNPPLIAAYTASALGIDSLYLLMPERLLRLRCFGSLTISLIPLPDHKVTHGVVKWVERLIDRRRLRADVVHVGPGFTGHRGYIVELVKLLDSRGMNLVIDSGALYPEVLSLDLDWSSAIIAPHEGEYKMLFEGDDPLFKLEEYNVFLKRLGGARYISMGRVVYDVSDPCWPTRYGSGYVATGLLSGSYALTGGAMDAAMLAGSLLVKMMGKLRENGCFHVSVERLVELASEVVREVSLGSD